MKVINLWGAPGSGKSTLAARLFAEHKRKGERIELVTEFAKGLVYAGDQHSLENQLYIFAMQDRRLQRLVGKVDYVVTDSPLPFSIIYAKDRYAEPWFYDAVMGAFKDYHNVNYFLPLQWEFEAYGRLQQNEVEVREIDQKIREFLTKQKIQYGIYGDIRL